MKKLVFLIPLFVFVLFIGIQSVDAKPPPVMVHPYSKHLTISQDSKLTIRSDGYGATHGFISACGQVFTYSYYINLDKLYYQWGGVPEKLTCKGVKYEFHHVYLEVWEGKADNIKDAHEMFFSPHAKQKGEKKDASSLFDPLDVLGTHSAFIYFVDND